MQLRLDFKDDKKRKERLLFDENFSDRLLMFSCYCLCGAVVFALLVVLYKILFCPK
jgi:hypothetical protein